ncbi:acid phosphatase AphA [Sansalvadorimonas verongulae]|uniref:acid phosphatase AphA n=1 Tax=Sansalvadorimonas verongulae TaxID=2172824 RepID=UPI0012BC505B|nr:acid phosphatase AphA [Sansalvadorimonas verongulae]MTI12213.1 class B acid phosphatase [Sansalvadorimonas verongulae]
MKKLLLGALLLAAGSAANAAPAKDVQTVDMFTASSALVQQYDKVHWVSVADIEKSLSEGNIVVGLDIDDTMLFSSPLFYYGKNKYSPDSFDYLNNQDFWNEANTGLDRKFSIPKKSALKLVNMHLKRGDTVYFVTGRTAPQGQETVTETIRALFPEQYRAQIKPVVFAHGLEKVKQLKAAKIKLFYGDADSDMTSAQEAGIEGIRFLRGAQTTYTPLPHAGKFGEKVLMNSNY